MRIVFIAALLAGSSTGAAAADSPMLRGVVRYEGRPIAGATVALPLVSWPIMGPHLDGPVTTTNENGEFALPAPDPRENILRSVIARDHDGRTGCQILRLADDFDSAPPLRIELSDVQPFEG